MTKKDFIAIAAILKNGNLAVVDEHDHPQAADIVMSDVCDAMADYFASENHLFNRKMFLTACGIERRM